MIHAIIRPVRVDNNTYLNGYISLPKGHPWYGRTNKSIEESEDLRCLRSLSYSKQEADRWVIGFDTVSCMHKYNFMEVCIMLNALYSKAVQVAEVNKNKTN